MIGEMLSGKISPSLLCQAAPLFSVGQTAPKMYAEENRKSLRAVGRDPVGAHTRVNVFC